MGAPRRRWRDEISEGDRKVPGISTLIPRSVFNRS
jgi:hypothetical protein